jgi:uncharacterized protein (TIGR03435 family)
VRKLEFSRNVLAVSLVVAVVLHHLQSLAQSPGQAGPKLQFEVASVKQNLSTDPATSNFPLDETDPNGRLGSRFAASGFTLPYYIRFAFKMTDYQQGVIWSELPEWARMQRFDIEARAEGNPTKDEMRQMLIELLADRFKLSFHHEMQQVPVFWLESVKPGKTGPDLKPHPADATCSNGSLDKPEPATASPPKSQATAPWPEACGVVEGKMSPTEPGLLRVGGRNVTLAQIANEMAGIGPLDRPVIDHTGLDGPFDFIMEFSPQFNRPLPPGSPQFDENGTPFLQALREHLGLKLVPQNGPADITVIDHIEHPSPN